MRDWALDPPYEYRKEARVGLRGTQLRPCLMGGRCGQDGSLRHRRGLCAVMAACQAGGDRDDSFPKDRRYCGQGGSLPFRRGQGGDALFILQHTPLAQM